MEKKKVGKIKYQPFLFLESPKPTKYKDIEGKKYLTKMDFLSIKDAKEFVKKYKDVDNFSVYGNQSFEYNYIAETYPNNIDWKFEDIVVANIDIEVSSENGFSTVEAVTEALQAITIRKRGKTYAFAYNDYKAGNDVTYIRCDDELDLIEQFLCFWESDYPDVITGWSVEFYDIPYLVNRIKKLLGENVIKRLSPWNHIRSREVKFNKKTQITYSLFGISTLDYIQLYKKFAPDGKSRENYKLNTICNIELGEKKLSYEEYGNLHNLYKENFQLFMDYNVRDTKLVEMLDDKLHLLQLAFKMAYRAKCNFDDVFHQTRMWDALTYNHLIKQNIIVPSKESSEKEEYEGAWVKEPTLGKHKWVVSFDFTSLYPKLQMQYNLSNDTILDQKDWDLELRQFMEQNITVETLLNKSIDTSILKKRNLTLTPNKQLYKRDKEGFFPQILRSMFNDRVIYKNKMKDAEKQLEKTNDPVLRAKLENAIVINDLFQQATKISINSGYGALGNNFFRLFDKRVAEAVTMSGQLAIHWVINGINLYLNKLLETKDKDYVIAADTDSMYLVLDKLVEKVYENNIPETSKVLDFLDKVCKDRIGPYVDKLCEGLADYTNAYKNEMEMKREKICDVVIIVAKKRYIWNVWDKEGIRYNKPKLSIVGLETRRSNVPEWAKKKIIEGIGYIIEGKEYKIHELIKNSKEEFMKLSIEDMAAPTGMNGLKEHYDPVTLYKKGTPAHVKGCIIYNEHLKKKGLDKKYPLITEGDKVKYVYLKLPNPTHESVIAFTNMLPSEFNLTQYIDYEMMYDKVLQTPITNILNVIGWTPEVKRTLF